VTDNPLADAPETVPARMVNECPRPFHLEWAQSRFATSEDIGEGLCVHRRGDRPGSTIAEADDRDAVLAGRETRSVWVASGGLRVNASERCSGTPTPLQRSTAGHCPCRPPTPLEIGLGTPPAQTALAALRSGAGQVLYFTGAVFPVNTTGLHCGSVRLRVNSTASPARLPGQHDRAPLRHLLGVEAVSRRDGVFPVNTTGLHCGAPESVRELFADRSSRSTRPGSIAAYSLKTRCAPPRTSSRSTRPGSIAARTGTARNRKSGCLPGQHDRAPLRPVDGDAVGVGPLVFPVNTTGLHCGGPLRGPDRRGPRVFPVNTTGLHCGLPRARRPQVMPSRLPGHHDRAPLRPGKGGSPPGAAAGLPGHHDRAPLRPGEADDDIDARAASSRSPRPGSIAVPVRRTVTTRSRPVFPVTTTGKTRSIYDAGWARSRSTSSHGVPRRDAGPVGTSEVLLSGSSRWSRHESRLR